MMTDEPIAGDGAPGLSCCRPMPAPPSFGRAKIFNWRTYPLAQRVTGEVLPEAYLEKCLKTLEGYGKLMRP